MRKVDAPQPEPQAVLGSLGELLKTIKDVKEKQDEGADKFAHECTERLNEMIGNPEITEEILKAIDNFSETLCAEDAPVLAKFKVIASWMVAMEKFGLFEINDDYEGREKVKKEYNTKK